MCIRDRMYMCYLLRVFQIQLGRQEIVSGDFALKTLASVTTRMFNQFACIENFSLFFFFIFIRESFNCGWTFFPSRMAHHPMQSTWNRGSQSSKIVFLMWSSFKMRWCFRLAMFPIISRFLRQKIFPCRAPSLHRGRMFNRVVGVAHFQALRKENSE